MVIKMAKQLEKVITSISQFLHYISMALVFLIMFLTLGDVVGRFFAVPIKGTYELTETGIGIAVLFSMAATQKHKGHTMIELLVERFPIWLQGFVEVVVHLISVILLLLVTWQLFEYGAVLKAGQNVTSDLSLPVYLFVWIGGVGMLLYTLNVLVDLVYSFHRLISFDRSDAQKTSHSELAERKPQEVIVNES